MNLKAMLGLGLETGVRAPDFSLMGADTKVYSLSQFEGKKVFLYFFPRAFTTGCTTQACSFRSSYDILKQNGYVLLGISTDQVSTLQAFTAKHELPFPLLSDASGRVCRDFQVMLPFGIANRVTYLVDKHGTIEKKFRFLGWKNYADSVLRGASVS